MPRSFRIVCDPHEVPLVEGLLQAEGFAFAPEPFSSWCRVLQAEPFPLGESLAARFGLLYIQDRSSMLPPLALDPPPGASVLDMCASPGSKTGFLAQLVGADGFVIGNEPSRDRLETLRQNLLRMNLPQAATCSYPGQELPFPEGFWSSIQLDPPCSGWGTVEKNPKVMELWTPEKAAALVALQRQLLAHAAIMLASGGEVLFSTCTTNVAENEEQVRWALDPENGLGLSLVPLAPPPGFVFAEPELPGMDGVLRVDPEASGAQGFFLARFRKDGGEAFERTAPGPDLPGRELDPEALGSVDGLPIDFSRLPEGKIFDFGGRAFFVPRAALGLPAALRFQGMLLGRLSEARPAKGAASKAKGGKPARAGKPALLLRALPKLRILLPALPDCPPDAALSVDDPADVRALLSGRSLDLPGKTTGAALYFRGLPLTRLTRKNGRAMLGA